MAFVANPIQLQERNTLVDSLRGFALLGVLIANMTGLVVFSLPKENIEQHTNLPLDKLTDIIVPLFIENKFITLFSLLFGYGFGVIIERVQARNVRVVPFFLKRMSILLLLGLLHICLWWGEILSTYALCGILLLAFRRVSNRSLLIWGSVLVFVISPLIQGASKYLLPVRDADQEVLFTNYLVAAHAGNLWSIAAFNYRIVDFLYIEQWTQLRDMAEILGKFLFGYYVLRLNLLAPGTLDARKLKKWRLYPMIIAAIYLVQRAAIGEPENKELKLLQFTFERVGILALALVYAITLALLFHRGKYRWLFNAFRFTGMMSLTNYLTHTLFFAFIFFGFGLGLLGELHLQWVIPICLGIYSLQVVFSKFWLKRMHYGPVEWLWRQATYGKRLPLRIKGSSR